MSIKVLQDVDLPSPVALVELTLRLLHNWFDGVIFLSLLEGTKLLKGEIVLKVSLGKILFCHFFYDRNYYLFPRLYGDSYFDSFIRRS